MQVRPLGATGLTVSAVAFGAGPVSGLWTCRERERQQAVVRRAIDVGINWFDTAATYGNGTSETALGETLPPEAPVQIATKVRLRVTDETDLRPLVVASVRESLARLRRPRVTLLQVHNAITWNREDQPTSITPDDVLGPRGVLAGMDEVRQLGWTEHFGLTGIGDAEALRVLLRSGRFGAIQAPLHLLNPSALRQTPRALCDPDYGGFLRDASDVGVGVFAIRVFAAGALLGAAPSAHTRTTPFFPLSLYERDLARARRLQARVGSPAALRELALRYALSQPQVSSAIIGFGAVDHVDEAARIAALPPLTRGEQEAVEHLRDSLAESG
jgi:aryl-alcohol dehydrogenase-like predicted oxidoreductase